MAAESISVDDLEMLEDDDFNIKDTFSVPILPNAHSESTNPQGSLIFEDGPSFSTYSSSHTSSRVSGRKKNNFTIILERF